MLLIKQVNVYLNTLARYVSFLISDISINLLTQTNFIEKYYIRNEYMWQDGFLFDFLQKKNSWFMGTSICYIYWVYI